ncbi:CopG family nickel-responsive transcriptional regulator [Acinetobacter calcoaceticus]|uniref:CopG family nickel-responsive transcriptional regulator n=1 Tax=Acinetobacter calcoaceticus TaxID=471 RepID=A0A4R1XEL5_ACICA|nr:CopG family nickel-responsive transcriptional regulator [Acinetobacter calcoaceticus]
MVKSKLARISITVPESTLTALDQKIVDQHYESRSQAIVDMINKHLIAEQAQCNEVMVGTLTLLYDVSSTALRTQLVDLQQQYLSEVISSLHIQLDDHKVLQVMLMQGVSSVLRQISQQFIVLKGVIKGHLELMDAVMPPLLQNLDQITKPPYPQKNTAPIAGSKSQQRDRNTR